VISQDSKDPEEKKKEEIEQAQIKLEDFKKNVRYYGSMDHY